MSKEIWKDVIGYEGHYQISNLGRVKSFKICRGVSERILKPSNDGKGYIFIGLIKNKVRKNFKIHKLIQSSFQLGSGLIDHINGERSDNRLENLRVVTHRENNQNRKHHREGRLVGASFNKAFAETPKPWQSRIRINGKTKHLGFFKTEIEANKAYTNAFKKLRE